MNNFLKSLINAGYLVWFLIVALIIFILWIFVGGGTYEYVGLAPLKIGVDSTKYLDDHMYEVIERGNYHADKVSGIDITPKIPASVEPPVPIRNANTIFVPPVVKDTNGFNLTPINPFIPSKPFESDPYKTKYSEEQISKALGIHKEFKTNRISKGEMKCKEIIEDIYGVPFYCVRPNFLKNPETKRNLELDLYNDELKIAIERNGIQHYIWPNYTGQSKEKFLKQLSRDKFKYDQCNNNGIYLITVPYTVELDEIRDYMQNNLPKITYINEDSSDGSDDMLEGYDGCDSDNGYDMSEGCDDDNDLSDELLTISFVN